MTPTDPDPPPERADAFRGVYESTYADLLRFVRRRVHPSHAEDVVADVFLVAWRRFDELPSDPSDVRAWLFGVAHRTLRNDLRGDRRRQALTIRVADATVSSVGSVTTEMDPDFVDRRIDLATAWRRLTPEAQETLALAVWDGLTAGQAATVLGISPVAFRLRLSRARRALGRYLDLTPTSRQSPAAALTQGSTS